MKYAERVSYIKPSDIRNPLFDRPDIISLAAGRPDYKVFPIKEIKNIMSSLSEDELIEGLQYSSSYGIEPLRKLIANKIMPSLGVNTTSENIVLTSGSQQGIYFSAQLFVNEGDTVICEEPSYVGAINIFEAAGAKVVGIPMDEDGMKMDVLRNVLETTPNARMIYTIPDFQNPSASVMSREKRLQLIELAEEYDIPIIEDSPYSELIYEPENKKPCLKSFDKTGRVMFMGTFSKTLCPGMRLGWVCADKEFVEKYMLIKTVCDLQCNTLSEVIISKYLEAIDWDKRLEDLRGIYKVKRDTIVAAGKKYLPECAKMSTPGGGFFAWIELDEKINADELIADAVEERVAYISGTNFFTGRNKHNFIRLGYSAMSVEEIEEGVKRLGAVLKKAGDRMT